MTQRTIEHLIADYRGQTAAQQTIIDRAYRELHHLRRAYCNNSEKYLKDEDFRAYSEERERAEIKKEVLLQITQDLEAFRDGLNQVCLLALSENQKIWN